MTGPNTPRRWSIWYAGNPIASEATNYGEADDGEIKIGDGEIAGANIRVTYPEGSVAAPGDLAAHYAEASGVPGWIVKASDDGKRIDVYAPPGYTIVYSHDHTWCLRKIDLTKYGVSIRKTAE